MARRRDARLGPGDAVDHAHRADQDAPFISDIGADAIDEIERLLRVLLSELVARGITANVPGLAWVPTRSNRRFSAANRRLRALLTGIIDGYRRAGRTTTT